MIDALARTVEAILGRCFGRSVRVGPAEELRANKAYRFPVDCPPGSVIAKKARDEAEVVYDPDEGEAWNPSWRLFGEWAGLAFVSSLPGHGEAPRFYGGDRAAGVIVLEDLGPRERMVDVLMGDDRARAEQVVILHAEALGRLHAVTVGHETEYQRIRDRLGPRVVQRDAQAWGDLAALREPLLRGLALAGVEPAPGFDDEYRVLQQAIEAPGPFRSFTHCDPCTDNCLIVDGRLRLIDYERAGYHHAPLDAVYARLAFPTCGIATRVPDELIARAEAAYRAELVRGCPAAADDRLFGEAVAQACAYWLVSNRNWLLESALKADHTWGNATWRQRVIARLEALGAVSAQQRCLEAIGETARHTAQCLRTEWPKTSELPLSPAFR